MSRQTRTLSTRWRKALEAIAEAHCFTLEELRGRARNREITKARLVCYRYLRAQGWSLPEIGGQFGRDHTAVLWALMSGETAVRQREIRRLRWRAWAAQQREGASP